VGFLVRELLQEMVKHNGSDLHLKVGTPPTMRVDGHLIPFKVPPPTGEEVDAECDNILTPRQKRIFMETNEVDFAFGIPGLARFRANFYRQRGSTAMVFRTIPFDAPKFDTLHLPPVIRELTKKARGLVLVTGTVGSGKSTTLASMIREVNETMRKNIITIEDPVEFLHRDNMSMISQREIGSDTESFHGALKHILRQDPDVILVGEIRDLPTMSIALTAANTGHLVFSTLHTTDASQAINRVISFFPLNQQQEIRFLMASCLEAIISMRLVPRSDRKGRIPAVEVMIATGTIKEYLLDAEKTHMIKGVIEESTSEYGMQSFDQALLNLYHEEKISLDDALRFASSPTELEIKAKGIEAGTDVSWTS
jgi:twitching motility protein PilT